MVAVVRRWSATHPAYTNDAQDPSLKSMVQRDENGINMLGDVYNKGSVAAIHAKQRMEKMWGSQVELLTASRRWDGLQIRHALLRSSYNKRSQWVRETLHWHPILSRWTCKAGRCDSSHEDCSFHCSLEAVCSHHIRNKASSPQSRFTNSSSTAAEQVTAAQSHDLPGRSCHFAASSLC